MTQIAVAALSARVLAEMAALEGYEVVALDLFGDRDTRSAATRWLSLGEPAALRIDEVRLLAALDELAAGGAVLGWLPGGGFEGRPELLEEGARRLPLIGNDAATVRRVRDPQLFFEALAADGIAHPPIRRDWPEDARGWLLKDAAGCGGWHIRQAQRVPSRTLSATAYLQRECAGTPMSATFVANGRAAVVLGCNEQLVRTVGDWPFLYSGVIGPVPVDDAVHDAVAHAVRALVTCFGLRGLGSLDFLCDGERVEVLELNPRPPASLALYPKAGQGGPVAAHLRGCAGGELPVVERRAVLLHGNEIVFAPAALRLDEALCAWLAAEPDLHDLPCAGQACAAGDPVCSIGAEGCSPLAVREQLAQRRDALLNFLETKA